MSERLSQLTLADPLTRGLACAALGSGLRSILVFDAPYPSLKAMASALALMLETTTKRKVEEIWLGMSELDDDLWGSFALAHDVHASPVQWRHGPFARLTSNSAFPLVIIPDLLRLSLATMRSIVMLIGADIAHLERHGQHERWQPDMCWLASCRRVEVGGLSPHLLDRFATRLSWYEADQPDRVAEVLRQLLADSRAQTAPETALPIELKAQLQQAIQRWPTLSSTALDQIMEYLSVSGTYTHRRELALARLARAHAQLDESSQILISHVDAAAELIGLLPASQQSPDAERPHEDKPPDTLVTDQQDRGEDFTPESNIEHPELPTVEIEVSDISVPAYPPDQRETLAAVGLPDAPYPEDTAPIEREVASLRLPLPRYSKTPAGHGIIIGVERTNTLSDLALISTLLAAAPFQAIRRQHHQADKHRLLLSSADLRRYRHEPVAEQMLLILLDYTSLGKSDWQQALAPYLSWAYTERARIGIIQVGAAGATNELCAELVSARSLLVPTVETALEAGRGRATPLAHGFDLALQTLRHALEHGRSTVKRALLVVISDGRGNVPLEVSRTGRRENTVINREGIEDALQLARQIGALKGVQVILLNPQPKHYPEVPLTLGEVMGAEILNIDRPGV